jgi:uncharacterized protein YecA (UPF0149 family)
MILKFDETKAEKDAPENWQMSSIAITTNYEESDNPHRHVPQVLQEQLPDLYQKAAKGGVQIIKKLEKLIFQYPKVPALYNYLSIAYAEHKNYVKFDKLNELMIQRFPNYSLPRLNQANRLILKGELDRAEAVLGQTMELKMFLPNREVYHISEVFQFYETTVRFFLHKRQFDVADSRLDLLKDISKQFDGYQKEKIKQLGNEKEEILEAIRVEDYDLYTVVGERKEWVAKTKRAPDFTHPEIQWLYAHGFDIPKEKIEQLLALPRETLIPDLHKVLDDAMARFDFFYEEMETEDGYVFLSHALMLLAELRSTTSLSLALNLIRQDSEWSDFYFDDLLTEKLPIYFYKLLGDNDWAILKNYLLEPNNHSFQRLVIPQALSILAYHHPEKRQAVISFLEDVLTSFYDNRHLYKDIIDVDVNDMIVADLLDLKSTESFTVAAKLFEANMISDEFGENLEDIKANFSNFEDSFYFFDTIPTIFEDYKSISDWDKPMTEEEHIAFLEKNKELKNEWAETKKELAERQRELMDSKRKLLEIQRDSPFSQVQSGEQKVGRNEPCPCGSGKKYKKCCGN